MQPLHKYHKELEHLNPNLNYRSSYNGYKSFLNRNRPRTGLPLATYKYSVLPADLAHRYCYYLVGFFDYQSVTTQWNSDLASGNRWYSFLSTILMRGISGLVSYCLGSVLDSLVEVTKQLLLIKQDQTTTTHKYPSSTLLLLLSFYYTSVSST